MTSDVQIVMDKIDRVLDEVKHLSGEQQTSAEAHAYIFPSHN